MDMNSQKKKKNVPSPQSLFRRPFLGAPTHLYNWLCPLVGRSVGRSVTHLFDDPHGAPYWPTWPFLVSNIKKTVDSFLMSTIVQLSEI